MTETMEEIRHVSVEDVLRARDERVSRQQAMLARHACPLVSFTLNIAGSVKNNALITRAFECGRQMILRRFQQSGWEVLDSAQLIAFTGCEGLWAVNARADELKTAMCAIEESLALGRLFDIDVIDVSGAHLSRSAERACLLCGGPVRACARSRAHSADALFEKTKAIIREHFQAQHHRRIGELAQKALLYEALTTPKPGLVDCENSGAHQDMDLFSFADSACALRSYFETCARLGAQNAPLPLLKQAGLSAEDEMFAAAGANTHKGAVFSLGILCYAMGSCGEQAALETLLAKAAQVGTYFLRQLETTAESRTGGEQQYRLYGLTGARGEAASGFQTVTQTALPALEEALHAGCSLPEAGLHALVHLMACVQDSNIIRRAGTEGQQWVQEQAKALLQTGVTAQALRLMNDRFVKRRISPGGSADLLAVAYFLHFVKTGGI